MKHNTIRLAVVILILFFFETNGQNTNPKGITIIAHGFQLSGSLDEGWYEFAAAIKFRAGAGATVFVNNDSGLWEVAQFSNDVVNRYGINGNGDPNNEMIFLYDWSKISNDKGDIGHIEAAADLLFARLINLPNTLNLSNQVGLFESVKPIHMIGHSRGTILLLQLCHRIARHFPNRYIEHYTSLDPHPALLMWDADINERILSLPGIDGEPIDEFNIGSLHLKLPNNILKADNYYRQDGVYEGNIPDFDGIPNFSINSLFNRKLSNSVLKPSITSIAHSEIHQWYLQTIDTLRTPTSNSWFQFGEDNNNLVSEVPKFRESRGKTGYNYSRLGGGLSSLPTLTNETMTLPEMESKIKNRYANNLEGLSSVFNGDFLFEAEAGWSQMVANRQKDDIEIVDYALKIKNNTSIFHNFLYFSANNKYVKFHILKNHIHSESWNYKIAFIFYDNLGNYVEKANISLPKEAFTDFFYVPIPNKLKGSTGTFEMTFTNFIDICYLDDISLTSQSNENLSATLKLKNDIHLTPCFSADDPFLHLVATSSRQGVSYELYRNNLPVSTQNIVVSQNHNRNLKDSTVFTEKSSLGNYFVIVKDLITNQSAISNTIILDTKPSGFVSIYGELNKPFGNPFNLSTDEYSTYLWEGLYGFNFQATTRNVLIPNNYSNYYHIKLTVTTNNGCIVSRTIILNSSQCSGYPPRNPLIITTNQPISIKECMTEVRITASGQILPSYLWRLKSIYGGINYIRTSQNFIDATVGSGLTISVGTYSADTSNVCFIQSNEIFLNVYPPGVKGNGTVLVNEGDNVTLSVDFSIFNSSVSRRIRWDGPNNFTSNEANTTIFNLSTCSSGYYKLTSLSDSVCKNQYGSGYTVFVYNGNKKINRPNQLTYCQGSSTYLDIISDVPLNCWSANLSSEELYLIQYSNPNGLFPNDTISNIIGTSNYVTDMPNVTFNMPISNNYRLRVIYFNKSSKIVWIGKPTDFSISIINGGNLDVISNNGNTICPNSTTTLSVKQIEGLYTTWTKDKVYIGYGNSITVNQTGIYQASAFGLDCKITSNQYKVYILNESNLSINHNSPIYEGDTLKLRTNLPLGIFYNWTGPLNFTSYSRQPLVKSVSISNSGQYSLLAKDICNRTYLTQININVLTRNVCESRSSGSWHNAQNWSCGRIPSILDNVIIKSEHQIYLDRNQSGFCKNLTVESGAVFNNNAYLFKTNSH